VETIINRWNFQVLENILQYFYRPAAYHGLRRVCSTWNHEVMRYYYQSTKIIRTMEDLARGLKILQEKTVNTLATKFMFHEPVDVTNPMFLEFLRASGEDLQELWLYFPDSQL